ncbi:MAG: hypothetical protein ACYS74_12705, partial [Planctomycetota bacterium]
MRRNGQRSRAGYDDRVGPVPVAVVFLDNNTAGEGYRQYHKCDGRYEPFHGHYSFLSSVAGCHCVSIALRQ